MNTKRFIMAMAASINRRPVVIEHGPRGAVQQPLSLRVPPGHERNWNQHCREYNACGQPVYDRHDGDRDNDRHN